MTIAERAERVVRESLPASKAARASAAGDDMRRRPISQALADVEPERVSWLWHGRIPLGKVTVIDGDPSLGKSTLTTDLAARVTTGSPMPDRSASDLPGPAGVVLISAEDGAADTIRPRADAAGADTRRIHLLTDVEGLDDEGRSKRVPWTMPRDLDMLALLVRETQSRLVVLDPLSAVLAASVDSYRDQDVRGALRPLADVAESTGAAIIIVRHLSKTGGANALYRGGGSIGIIGAARSALLVAKDPDDESGHTRILVPTKSNLAELPCALRYELVGVDEHGCARVRWLGESTHTANALLAEPASDDERSEQGEIATMLLELTADGPISVEDARKALRAAGYDVTPKTLQRARARAGLVTGQPSGFGGKRSIMRAEVATRSVDTPVSQDICSKPVQTDANRENGDSAPSVDIPVGLSALSEPSAPDPEWQALCERIRDLPGRSSKLERLSALGPRLPRA